MRAGASNPRSGLGWLHAADRRTLARMQRHALLALLLASCAAPDAPPVQLALDDVTVVQAVASIAGEGLAIAIGPDASIVASCAHVTLHTPGPVPRAEAARLLARALESSALAMRETPEGWLVTLASTGRIPSSCTEYLLGRLAELVGGGGPTVSARPADPPQVAPEPAEAVEPAVDTTEIVAGIRATSETEIVLTPAARDALLERSTAVTGSVRIIPQQEDGRVVGLRLFGIRAGSPMAALGLRNGDVLVSIAGHDVSSPDAALEAYAEVRGATGPVEVEIRRAERALTLRYRVDDAR